MRNTLKTVGGIHVVGYRRHHVVDVAWRVSVCTGLASYLGTGRKFLCVSVMNDSNGRLESLMLYAQMSTSEDKTNVFNHLPDSSQDLAGQCTGCPGSPLGNLETF